MGLSHRQVVSHTHIPSLYSSIRATLQNVMGCNQPATKEVYTLSTMSKSRCCLHFIPAVQLMMSHYISEHFLIGWWLNILLGQMSFALYWYKCNSQDYEPDITSMTVIMFTTVALSKHVVAWRIIIAFLVLKHYWAILKPLYMNI